MSESKTWTIVAGVAAVIGGIALRSAADRAWRVTRGEEPPKTPTAQHANWRGALVWSGVAGLAAGLGRMLAREAAARGWTHWKGERPST